jgi:hypothetical protein
MGFGRAAARLPIRTFSSGATNSMRGAAYLSGLGAKGSGIVGNDGGSIIVVDVSSSFSTLCPNSRQFSLDRRDDNRCWRRMSIFHSVRMMSCLDLTYRSYSPAVSPGKPPRSSKWVACEQSKPCTCCIAQQMFTKKPAFRCRTSFRSGSVEVLEYVS